MAQGRRRHLVVAHKANVLTKTTGLFRDVCADVGRGYPDVAITTEHIDALAARFVSHPKQFDVVVTENMFGDILSDLAAQLSGSLGMAPSINASDTKAMAQASHGSAPDIAGTDTANPVAMILSAGMLLRWLSERRDSPRLADAADLIDAAVTETLNAGVRTPDIGGSSGTADFTRAVLGRLR
jgi:3-isopropylmalate dehydrogenase